MGPLEGVQYEGHLGGSPGESPIDGLFWRGSPGYGLMEGFPWSVSIEADVGSGHTEG